jgi:hypothetical protein
MNWLLDCVCHLLIIIMKVTYLIRSAQANAKAQIKQLESLGYTAKLTGSNSLIGDMPIVRPENSDKKNTPASYNAKGLPLDTTFRIEGVEGIAIPPYNHAATIVAGIDGKYLRPYYIPRSFHSIGNSIVTARFSVPQSCSIAMAFTNVEDPSSFCLVENHVITVTREREVSTLKTTIWMGSLAELELSHDEIIKLYPVLGQEDKQTPDEHPLTVEQVITVQKRMKRFIPSIKAAIQMAKDKTPSKVYYGDLSGFKM